MILKLIFIQICTSISVVTSYVLFAANIDDFRSLAKRIVPDNLADQLADMASKSSVNYRNEKSRHDKDSEEGKDPRVHNNIKRYNINKEVDIDIDELVKRVKEKLEKEYQIPARGQIVTDKTPDINDYYYKDENMNAGNVGQDYDGEVYGKDTVIDQDEPQYDVAEGDAAEYDSPHKASNYNNDYSDPSVQPYANENNRPYKVKQIIQGPEENIQIQLYSDENAKVGQYGQQQLQYNENAYNQPYSQYANSGNYQNNLKAPVDQYNAKYGANKGDYREDTPYYTVKTTTENAINYQTVKEHYNAKKILPQEDPNAHVNEEVKKVPVYYEDEMEKDLELTGKDGELLKEVDLRNIKDSYEDYVTPEKGDIFESEEKTTKSSTSRATKQPNVHLVSSEPKMAYQKSKKIEKAATNTTNAAKELSTVTVKREFGYVKAKTESLWYDEAKMENYDESTKADNGAISVKPTKKLKGTMIPTREYFKMSSPNYYAKLKAVAEKYNFDEPIPEKDRVKEVIKEIGNPPAMINKKVKLES